MGLVAWFKRKMVRWLTRERRPAMTPLCDFDRLASEIRPGDVLLVEGRSHVSEVIKTVTLSPWTHAALYVGRIEEIEDDEARRLVRLHYNGSASDRVVIEAELGRGTVVTPLARYRRAHLRVCRPNRLSRHDAHQVIRFAADHLGTQYDVRHLLDLARFLFPYGFLPRRWRSSLFAYRAGPSTRTLCSSMLAAAFTSVNFPVLPVVHRTHEGELRLYKRNPRLFTPRDFDYSPYFDVVKYPSPALDDIAIYRQLPWGHEHVICDAEGECRIMVEERAETTEAAGEDAVDPTAAVRRPSTSHGS